MSKVIQSCTVVSTVIAFELSRQWM